MDTILSAWSRLTAWLEGAGPYVAPLALRIILAWEFFESGLTKFNGNNWFADVQEKFPFPFNILPPDLSWFMATWSELVFALTLLVGLATRLSAAVLMVLTVVATAAIHWPQEWNTLGELLQGYGISDRGFGNYKLPVLYLIMFLPLLFGGAGKLSLDHLIARRFGGQSD